MKLSIHYISCKSMKRFIPTLLFLLSLNNSAYGQVTKYERLNSIGRRTFNFAPNAQKYKDLLVV